jgi:hypothetical protein
MKMKETECSETLAYKFQTPGNYSVESIQQSEHGESLKSRIFYIVARFRVRRFPFIRHVCIVANKLLLPSSCPSVCRYVSVSLPLGTNFRGIWVLTFIKICRGNKNLFKIWQKYRQLKYLLLPLRQ